MSRFSEGHVALVTGAAGDIGAASARRLAADGASVVLADLAEKEARLDTVRRQCRSVAAPSSHAKVMMFDVTDAAAVSSALTELSDGGKGPDLLFNNAGAQGDFAPVTDMSINGARQVLEINVLGVLIVLQAWARSLHASGRPGAAVNTASMAGVGGAPNMAAYSASKAAVLGLTKAAAKDLAPLGMRVNAVSPGFIGPGAMWDNQVRRQAEVASIHYGDDEAVVAEQMIGQVPLRRYGSVDEVAATVSFLLSDDASYLTGQNIEISGGAS